MRKIGLLAIALASAVAVMLFYASPILAAGNGCMNCDDWARTPVRGEYLLENNVWGDKAADVCSFVGDDFFGWFWTKRFSTTGKPIYPEVIYGKKPWLKKSTTELLPSKIKRVRSLIVEVDYETIALGEYNVLIDVWITKFSAARPEVITHEIGIYLKYQKTIEKCGETVEIDGHLYCHKVSKPKWTFHQFILIDEDEPEKIDIMDFIKRAGISRELYIASVEFGNEVWHGNGVTIVKTLNITLTDP